MTLAIKDKFQIPVDKNQLSTGTARRMKNFNPVLTNADAKLWDAIFHDDVALAHVAISEGADPYSRANPFYEDCPEQFPDRQVSALEYTGLAAAKNVAWYLRDIQGFAVHVPCEARSLLFRYNEEAEP